MDGTILNFYASGNTAEGFANLYNSSLQGLTRLFVLKGGPGTGKSRLIREIGEHMAQQGYEIWILHCAADNDSLDGVIIPKLKAGIVDGTAPHVIEPELPETVIVHVDVEQAADRLQLNLQKQEIDSLTEQITQAHNQAYSGFAEALRIHDEWETIYIASMNFQLADELTQEYIELLYGDRKLERVSRVDRRFLGATTPKGAVDYVPNLTAGLKRYLVKGRAGSGKSTLLKKLAAEGIQRGFDIEIYHCGFDPNSLDMIIVRELGFAIFDSTAPHEYEPVHATDEIVDMYSRCIQTGTDEAHSDAIADIKERYSKAMKQSIQHLTQAKSLRDELKEIYAATMDVHLVDQIRSRIEQEIREYLVSVSRNN
ncbi:thymidylate kinase [Paenibacillus sp. RC73]|uniref:PRK06851 family protein n=1 Tax=unclassified Paenibacillus TaxID=185978 RepID=UPI0038390D97